SIFIQQPDRYKIAMQAEHLGTKFTVVQAVDRDKAWSRTDEEDQKVEAAELAELKMLAYVQHLLSLLPLLKDKSLTLSALSEEIPVQGEPARGVRVVSQGRKDVTLYFAKASGLLVKVEYRWPDLMTKKEALREEFFSDYREVNPAAADEQLLKAAQVS